MNAERLLSSRELGEALGFSSSTIQDWYEAGKLPGFRIGGRLRFRASEVERWLEQHRRGPRPGSSNQPTGDPAPGFRV